MSLCAHARGFSLVEFLMSMTILSILAFVAIPAFSNVLRDSQIDSATSKLIGMLAKTRTEAITHRRRIGACRKASDAQQCAGYSRFGSVEWESAIIFQDLNQNNRLDLSEKIISVIDLSVDDISIRWGRGDILFYDGDGTARGMSNGTFQILAASDLVREVIISLPGRYRVVSY
jgi:type IV fimbrial biogenesis protein FimT